MYSAVDDIVWAILQGRPRLICRTDYVLYVSCKHDWYKYKHNVDGCMHA